jgi:hypothetical protein
MFPAKFPIEKPRDIPLSPAMARLYDFWGCKAEYDNEFYTKFKFSDPEGFDDDGLVSRRDPSKVIRVDGRYYVYYTCRRTRYPVVRPGEDDDDHPSTDWDLADIYVAESADGFRWEEKGPALSRSPKGRFGWRSLSTPDVLPWRGRYYLFVQVYNDLIREDSCPVGVAVSDSPLGPFQLLERELVPLGPEGSWDARSIHDPYPLAFNGKVYLYYKGQPANGNDPEIISRAQGVAIADSPEGPFTKHAANPVLNSGHETMLWPYREGIAALLIRDGNEANTIQFAADGLSFDLKAIVDIAPHAGGPYIPDVSADNRDGRGILWGLSFVLQRGSAATGSRAVRSRLMRFDCSLSRDVVRPGFKGPKQYNEAQFRAFPLSPDERRFLEDWTDQSGQAPAQPR